MKPASFTVSLLSLLAILGVVQPAMAVPGRTATAGADVELWRLNCGSFPDFDISGLADDGRYDGQRKTLADGCYLIRHDADFMLWDAGLPPGKSVPSIVDQMKEIGVRPEQVRYLAISHAHPDHYSQAAQFQAATLLIGAADWAVLKNPPAWFNSRPLQAWLTGKSKVDLIAGDPLFSSEKDVFGDGTVRIIPTPGHTPGHCSLLIMLRHKGAVMLTGDLWHLRKSYEHDAVPIGNVNRAETLASMSLFKALAARYHALVVVQHDPDDIGLLPPFPRSAH